MPTTTILQKCKTALRVTTTAYDDEISEYIGAAALDLGIAGVEYAIPDEIVNTAIITYVRMHFGTPSDFDKLRSSYNEQKAQLMNASGYTDFGVTP